jgi:hypothetical protein
MFLLWDWNTLPGITIPTSTRGNHGRCATMSGKGDNNFMGGVSDGHFGVFVM